MARRSRRKRQRGEQGGTAAAVAEALTATDALTASAAGGASAVGAGAEAGAAKAAGGLGGLRGLLGKFKGVAPIVAPLAANALIEGDSGPSRDELQGLLDQLNAGGGESAAGLAASRVGGLDNLLRSEREVASQAPPGTAAATPIVDRLQVLMPELLAKLRQRVQGGLWADLADGEVLIQGGPSSRQKEQIENQTLEISLRDELGFSSPRQLPMDARALIG